MAPKELKQTVFVFENQLDCIQNLFFFLNSSGYSSISILDYRYAGLFDLDIPREKWQIYLQLDPDLMRWVSFYHPFEKFTLKKKTKSAPLFFKSEQEIKYNHKSCLPLVKRRRIYQVYPVPLSF